MIYLFVSGNIYVYSGVAYLPKGILTSSLCFAFLHFPSLFPSEEHTVILTIFNDLIDKGISNKSESNSLWKASECLVPSNVFIRKFQN